MTTQHVVVRNAPAETVVVVPGPSSAPGVYAVPPKGRAGDPGPQGLSAYEVAVDNGFVGTEAEWLLTLVGTPGTTSFLELDDVPATFPPSPHTHDDRYYTETETDEKFALKADLTDLEAYTTLTALADEEAAREAADAALDGRLDTVESTLPTLATSSALTAGLAGKADTSHTHTSGTITDWTEAVQDALAGFFNATGATFTYNDAGNEMVVEITGGGGDPESIRDTIGAALIGVGLISVTVNDAADTITISTTATQNSTDAALRDRATHTGSQAISTVTGLQDELDALEGGKADASHTHPSTQISDFTEAAQDVIGGMIVAAGGTYNDAAGTITIPTGLSSTSRWRGTWSSVKLIKAYDPITDGLSIGTVSVVNTTTPLATLARSSCLIQSGTLPLASNIYRYGQRASGVPYGAWSTQWDIAAPAGSTQVRFKHAHATGPGVYGQDYVYVNGTLKRSAFEVNLPWLAFTETISPGQIVRFVSSTNANSAGEGYVGDLEFWGTNDPYLAGDLVYYAGKFWECASAGTTSTPGSDGTWTGLNVLVEAADITDFNEGVDDRVAALLVPGNNIDITYDDTGNTLTIDVEPLTQSDISGLTAALGDKLDTSAAPELIRDTMGTALVAGSNVTITPNDAGDTITIAATGGSGGGSGNVILLDYGASVPGGTPVGTIVFIKGPAGEVTYDFTQGALPAGWSVPASFAAPTFDGTGMTWAATGAYYVSVACPFDSDVTVRAWVESQASFSGIMFGPGFLFDTGYSAVATRYGDGNFYAAPASYTASYGSGAQGFSSGGLVTPFVAELSQYNADGQNPPKMRARFNSDPTLAGAWSAYTAPLVWPGTNVARIGLGCILGGTTVKVSKVTVSGAGGGRVGWWDGSAIQPLSTLTGVGPATDSETLSWAGVLATFTGTFKLYNDSGKPRTLTKLRASVGSAPTGGPVVVDVNVDGTSVTTSKVSIAAGALTAAVTPSTTLWPDGSYLTVDVDTVGSTLPGTDLSVTVSWTE